ncbi:hypothetical protein [Streptomyces sp. NRRL F-5555]|uniref:hypothetical protein n=1 Tax=Streptomyces sp. NRRL F-5555 TaxID=1463863 RepID=UPI000AE7F91A|nr:hypothetical protein [Streptomyces sp. NRRL F-5555]
MRSARMLLTTAAASAVFVLGAPGGRGHEESGDERGSENRHSGDEREDGSRHDEPRGGMHTGGGALAAVNRPGSRGVG